MSSDSRHIERRRGVVVSFLARKGYGFILNEGGEKLFVHFSDIRGKGFRTLEPGEDVEYVRVESERGPQAIDVVRLSPPPESVTTDSQEVKKTW